MNFIIKATNYFPLHLKYVATLPWEVKTFKFVKRYKKYNLQILSYVTEIKHFMSYSWKSINTAQVSIFAHTDALGCGWLHGQWHRGPRNAKRSVSTASVGQCYALATNKLAARRRPISINKPD